MSIQMPERATLPTAPLCSTLKKKYTKQASVPSTNTMFEKDDSKSNPFSPITMRGLMVGPIWLRKSASSEEINRRPQNTPMIKAVGQRLIQPILGARRSNNKTDSARGINSK